MEQIFRPLIQFRDQFELAAAKYDGTLRHSLELQQTIDDYSAFIVDESNQRRWRELGEQNRTELREIVNQLRDTSARCVAIMEKYRALKLLHNGDDRNDYFHHIESSIKNEFGCFEVSADSRVLLVGSGSFPMTPLLIAKHIGAEVIGIDLDAEAVDLGRKVIERLGPDLRIRLEHLSLESLDDIHMATHIIFSSTVSVKYALLDWLHDVASPHVVVAMRYGDDLKSLFNYPMEETDAQKWKLADKVAQPGRIFDVALYTKVVTLNPVGGARS